VKADCGADGEEQHSDKEGITPQKASRRLPKVVSAMIGNSAITIGTPKHTSEAYTHGDGLCAIAELVHDVKA